MKPNPFNQPFSPHPTTPDRTFRKEARTCRKRRIDFNAASTDMICEAIENSKKSKALDGIASIEMHYLGELGHTYLQLMINAYFNSAIIRQTWRVRKVVPIPKQGKDLEQSKNYRPIAIFSPVAKLAEKLLLPTLEKNIKFQNHQQRFRPNRSTNTALNCINHVIKSGLNKPKPCHRTLLVALDLKSAFDTISHGTLLPDKQHRPSQPCETMVALIPER